MAPGLKIRTVEVAVGAAFTALAAFVATEGVRLGPGWDDSGPQPGFFPFSLALLMGMGGLATLVRALRTPSATPFFEVRQEIVDLVKVGVPLALAVASVPFLGFYVMTTLYIGLFATWYGRHRWYLAFPGALAGAYVMYMGLERGFRIPMPKSLWYGALLPF